jgi:small subunit ribosomal protein S3
MSHKVNPRIFRIRGLQDWGSRWFSGKNFSQYLEEDFKIRTVLEKEIETLNFEKIEIERFTKTVKVIIFTSRPGLVVGRGGEKIKVLKKAVEKIVALPDVRMEVKEVKNPWASATLAGKLMAQSLEKRMPFRRVMKQGLSKIMSAKEVKGARIEIAGRLNGSEIARTEWVGEGRLPRQTIRADIDYGTATAFCSYGALGLKIWIYKGEKF